MLYLNVGCSGEAEVKKCCTGVVGAQTYEQHAQSALPYVDPLCWYITVWRSNRHWKAGSRHLLYSTLLPASHQIPPPAP